VPDAIIDSHIHTYRTADEGRRAQQGTGRSGQTGAFDEYVELLAGGAIEAAVMVNMTPVAEMRDALVARGQSDEEASAEAIGRLQRRNAWTCKIAREHPRLIPYISVDPSMGEEGVVAELTSRLAEGARGVKLHPANQRFAPGDRRLWPLYEEAQRLELPIISHCGLSFDKEFPEYASPTAFREVLDQFPRLTVVLAHLGYGFLDESFEMAAGYPSLMFDCSYAVEGSLDPPAISDEDVVTMFRRVGAHRVLFASDWPWGHPLRDAERIRRLPLTDEEKGLILGDNARRVLGIDIAAS